MSNTLKFELKKEASLDKNFEPTEHTSIGLYACVDGISSWVGCVDTIEDVRKAINPNNIDNLFSETLSCDELEIIQAVLFSNPKYKFFDEEFIYKKNIN